VSHIIWTTFVEFDSEEKRLRLPAGFLPKPTDRLPVRFGVGSVPGCDLETLEATTEDEDSGTSYKTPAVTYISSQLARRLHLSTSLVYQLKLDGNELLIGPTIGLLFGNNKENYTPDFMKEHYSDRLGVYPQIGGMVVAFAITAVDWNKSTIDGLIFDPASKTWVPGITPIPAVTYRRHVRQPNFKDFRTNLHKQNGILFNSARYTKWKVHNILQKNPLLLKYLPETMMLNTYPQLIKFLDRHNKVVLKPKAGSQGKGILFVEKTEFDGVKKYVLSDYRDNKSDSKISLLKADELRKLLEENNILNKKYICQQFISLAKIDGAPFDVRILMQKDESCNWRVSGIESRVASKDKEVTNLAAGGVALSLQKTVELMGPQYDYQLIHDRIVKFCMEYCFWMDQMKDHHYAEFGIDIGLDFGGNPWFIEANYRPGFKGFKQFDHNMFLEIGYTPFRYATSLQGFGIDHTSILTTPQPDLQTPATEDVLDDEELEVLESLEVLDETDTESEPL